MKANSRKKDSTGTDTALLHTTWLEVSNTIIRTAVNKIPRQNGNQQQKEDWFSQQIFRETKDKKHQGGIICT